MTHPEFEIRTARASERGAILALWAELLRTHRTLSARFPLAVECQGDRPLEARVAPVLERELRDPDVDVWVAHPVDSGAGSGAPLPLLGFCIARWVPAPEDLSETSRASLDELFVAAPHRRRGLGRRLAERAFDALHRRGARRVEIRVLRENPGALAFWRSLGFATAVEVMERSLDGR